MYPDTGLDLGGEHSLKIMLLDMMVLVGLLFISDSLVSVDQLNYRWRVTILENSIVCPQFTRVPDQLVVNNLTPLFVSILLKL